MSNSANLYFGVSGPTIDFKTEVVVSEENASRIMNYLVNSRMYGVVTGEDGETIPATPQQAAQAFADGVLESLIAHTVRYERDLAAKEAQEKVAPIAPENL